jgi:DNA-binding transcriptional regulator YdaS (Cro superfamily)
MSEDDVIRLIRTRVKAAGSQRALTREWGISPAHMSDVLSGRRGPGPKILDRLNLRRVVRVDYQPASWRKGERAC